MGPISLEYKERIAVITIADEGKLNALSQDGYYDLAVSMREVAKHDEVFITVLTGKGRYFSACKHFQGAARWYRSQSPLAQKLRLEQPSQTDAFANHPKILVNGPAVGLSAALIAWSDFIYSSPNAFILTPFSSLGLVAEGGASRSFVQRLGISKANEALIMSKRISADELLQVGFVNKIFDAKGDDFLKLVLDEVENRLGEHLNGDSLIKIKALIRRPDRDIVDAQGVAEVFGGLERFSAGIPQKEFAKLASGEKRHKL